MAKNKMNVKDFDYKQFLLEKGEKVGLGVAIAVMALLLVGGILKSLGASPSKNREDVLKPAADKAQAIRNSTLPGDKKIVPPDLIAAVNPKDVAAEAFALDHPWFTVSGLEDTKWRRPEIQPVGPATYQIVQSQVAKWAFDPSKETVLVRAAAAETSDEHKAKRLEGGLDEKTAKRLRKMRRDQERMQRLLQGGGGMRGRPGGGMMGGQPGGGMMGRPGGGMMGMMGGGPPGGMMGMMGGGMSIEQRMRGMGNPASMMSNRGGGSGDYKLETVSLDDALKKNLTPARVAVPITEAVVCAEFPFKKQMESFRKALRYPSVEAMLADPKVWMHKDDPKHPPTISFLGFRIERRAIGPDGQVVQPWQQADLETPYREVWRYSDTSIKSASDSEADLMQYGLIINDIPSRLVWALPPLMPKDQKYADVTSKLPDLKKALDNSKKEEKPKDTDTTPKNPYESDPFTPSSESSGPSGPPSGPGAPPTMGPGSGRGGPGDMQERMQMMMKMAGGKGGGRGGPAIPPGGPMNGGFMTKGKGGPGSTFGSGPAIKIPEWCLVRFIDVTVHPGFTYEYRVQLRLANPLYNRKDQALSEEMTKKQEIVGPDKPHLLTTLKDGKEVPLEVHVPADTYVYAVDEKPTGVRAVIPASNNRLAIQVHRWLDTLQTNKVSRVPVGEWAIAQRELARRGEFLGQSERVQLPIWSPQEDKYLFANSSDENRRRGTRRHKGALVDFSTDALLVDFQGGEKVQMVGDQGINDKVPVEMLILTSDGRLVVRTSTTDAPDKERKERLDAWRQHVKDIKEAMDEDKNQQSPNGGKMNPFNMGGGKR